MSLQVWLPLTRGTGINNQGLSDATFTSSGITLSEVDGMGSSYSCAGNGFVVSNKKIFLGQKQSVFCWVKLNSFNSSSSLTGICGQHNYHNCVGMGLNLIYASSTSGYVGVSTGNGNSRTYKDYKGSTLLSAGTWYHIGYTYDGSTIRLYVNGKLDGTYSFSNMATPPDYFQAFQWSLATTGTMGVQGGYAMNGFLNDVRAYDHVLNTKEIKELAKGLMLYYPLNDFPTRQENLVAYPKPGVYYNVSTGWDANLHQDAIAVYGWSQGYNGGVPTPEKGYHAHWKMIEDVPTMVFPKLPADGVASNRWLGICSTDNLRSVITQGTTYVVSFEAKADVPGREIYLGYYYHNGSANNFHDGYAYARDIPTTEWKRYTFSWVAGNVTTNGSGNFYFYGNSGADGVAYVRNVYVTKDTRYAYDCHFGDVESRNVIYDSSGMGNNATIIQGSVNMAGGNKTAKTDWNNNNAHTNSANPNNAIARTSNMCIPPQTTISVFACYPSTGHLLDWRESGGAVGLQPIYFDGSKKIQYWNSTNQNADYFNYQFTEARFYHICFVADESSVSMYVDGVLQQTKANALAPSVNNTPLSIWARCSNTNITSTVLGDLRIYRTKFSAEDVKLLYQAILIDKQNNTYSKNLETNQVFQHINN